MFSLLFWFLRFLSLSLLVLVFATADFLLLSCCYWRCAERPMSVSKYVVKKPDCCVTTVKFAASIRWQLGFSISSWHLGCAIKHALWSFAELSQAKTIEFPNDFFRLLFRKFPASCTCRHEVIGFALRRRFSSTTSLTGAQRRGNGSLVTMRRRMLGALPRPCDTWSPTQKLFFCCDQISLQRACRKTVQVLIVIFHDFSIFHRIFKFLSWLEKHWGGIILQKVLRKEAEDEAGHSEWDFRIHGIHGQFFNDFNVLHIVLGQPWTNGPMDSSRGHERSYAWATWDCAKSLQDLQGEVGGTSRNVSWHFLKTYLILTCIWWVMIMIQLWLWYILTCILLYIDEWWWGFRFPDLWFGLCNFQKEQELNN